MNIFQYLPHRMAPLDNEALRIYKKYLRLVEEIEAIWQRGILSGHLIDRSYEDIRNPRLKFTINPKRNTVTPVMSIVPVIGDEAQRQINNYAMWFHVYHQLSNHAVALSLTLDRDGLAGKHQDFRRRLRGTLNVLKLHITLMNIGEYDYENQIVFQDEDGFIIDNFSDPGNVSSTVGPHFMATGEVDVDIDKTLIQSYREFTQKIHSQDDIAFLLNRGVM